MTTAFGTSLVGLAGGILYRVFWPLFAAAQADGEQPVRSAGRLAEPDWAPLSDLIAALTLVFMLVAVLFVRTVVDAEDGGRGVPRPAGGLAAQIGPRLAEWSVELLPDPQPALHEPRPAVLGRRGRALGRLPRGGRGLLRGLRRARVGAGVRRPSRRAAGRGPHIERVRRARGRPAAGRSAGPASSAAGALSPTTTSLPELFEQGPRRWRRALSPFQTPSRRSPSPVGVDSVGQLVYSIPIKGAL